MPPQSLGTVVAVAALLLAAWTLVPVIRNRPPGRTHWLGLIFVQALVVAEVIVGIEHLRAGAHPREYATFIGYLVALFLVLPLAMLLARLEPTRWGALVITVATVVVPVLILRVNQLWSGSA
jgi:hypothetical protein